MREREREREAPPGDRGRHEAYGRGTQGGQGGADRRPAARSGKGHAPSRFVEAAGVPSRCHDDIEAHVLEALTRQCPSVDRSDVVSVDVTGGPSSAGGGRVSIVREPA